MLSVALFTVAIASCLATQTHKIVAEGAQLQKIGGGYAFTEGPAADKEGNIYFTDQPNDRIMKWSTDGTVTEWMKPCGRSNGMWFDHRGNLIACADEHNQLWSIAPDKSVTVLVKDFEGKLLDGPNDVWVRPDGGMYITDPLYVRDYWTRDPASQQPCRHTFFLSPDHKTLKAVSSDLKQPNGIMGTPDGKTLYVSDIDGGQTWKYKIQRDGSLTDKTLFCSRGSDGMIIDREGNLYLTGHGVFVYDKEGTQILEVPVPENWVGHVTFGGKNHDLLFITASRGIYSLQMTVKGAY